MSVFLLEKEKGGRRRRKGGKITKKKKRVVRSMAEKDIDKAKSQSVLAAPVKIEDNTPKSMILPTPSRAPFPSTSTLSNLSKEKKHFPKGEKICQIDRPDLERDLSTKKKRPFWVRYLK